MTDAITVETADDVTEAVLKAAEEAEEWYENEARVDWDSYWDRLDQYGYFIPDLDCPAARKIQAHVRQIRRERD